MRATAACRLLLFSSAVAIKRDLPTRSATVINQLLEAEHRVTGYLCIGCPLGCRLEVDAVDDGIDSIEGEREAGRGGRNRGPPYLSSQPNGAEPFPPLFGP